MFEVTKRSLAAFAASVLLCAPVFVADTAHASEQQAAEVRDVDVVIALDVSGSMSGLIESAKQRLWDVVNELGRAQPQPNLRIAILTYGNPDYGSHNGYVKIDLPFTSNLDAVNQTLFSFGTNGGDEYVARVVSKAVHELAWSREADALRILFVAGNEESTQDPQISVPFAAAAAANAGIVVNTIYCGAGNDAIAAGWREVAALTNGLYASIDQHSAAVANIATPMDTELARLSQELNKTYVAYGRDGGRYRDNQVKQDANAAAMSPSAVASRAVTKASGLYDSSAWDIVDAVGEGKDIDEIETENLPVEMQVMNKKERAAFVEELTAERAELQAQISELDQERRAFIAEEKSKRAETESTGLDDAMKDGLRTLAEGKGFSFE